MENTFCRNQNLYYITPFRAVATYVPQKKALKEAGHKMSPHLGVQVPPGPLTYRPTSSPWHLCRTAFRRSSGSIWLWAGDITRWLLHGEFPSTLTHWPAWTQYIHNIMNETNGLFLAPCTVWFPDISYFHKLFTRYLQFSPYRKSQKLISVLDCYLQYHNHNRATYIHAKDPFIDNMSTSNLNLSHVDIISRMSSISYHISLVS